MMRKAFIFTPAALALLASETRSARRGCLKMSVLFKSRTATKHSLVAHPILDGRYFLFGSFSASFACL